MSVLTFHVVRLPLRHSLSSLLKFCALSVCMVRNLCGPFRDDKALVISESTAVLVSIYSLNQRDDFL